MHSRGTISSRTQTYWFVRRCVIQKKCHGGFGDRMTEINA